MLAVGPTQEGRLKVKHVGAARESVVVMSVKRSGSRRRRWGRSRTSKAGLFALALTAMPGGDRDRLVDHDARSARGEGTRDPGSWQAADVGKRRGQAVDALVPVDDAVAVPALTTIDSVFRTSVGEPVMHKLRKVVPSRDDRESGRRVGLQLGAGSVAHRVAAGREGDRVSPGRQRRDRAVAVGDLDEGVRYGRRRCRSR